MTRGVFKLAIRVGLAFAVLVVGYCLVGRWNASQVEILEQVRGEISGLRWNLVQNRVAAVSLKKLDERSGQVRREKSDLVAIVEQTGRQGLEVIEKARTGSKTTTKLVPKWQGMLGVGEDIYQRQREMLDKLYGQKTFADGMKVLRSPEAVGLVTDQTNLILELEYWERETVRKLQPNR